jgi:hypothetical protein
MVTAETILIHLPDSGALNDFLRSTELTAIEIRRDTAAAIVRGASVVVLAKGEPPRPPGIRANSENNDIWIVS